MQKEQLNSKLEESKSQYSALKEEKMKKESEYELKIKEGDKVIKGLEQQINELKD